MKETDKETLLRILCECGWIIKSHSYDNTIYIMIDYWNCHKMTIEFTTDGQVFSIEVEEV